MPTQNHSGIRGVPWKRCDRCGRDFPIDRLVKQRGLLLCIDSCWDNPIMFEREEIIQDVLEFGSTTELEPVDVLKRDEEDTREF